MSQDGRELDRIADSYFTGYLAHDPISASMLGMSDHLDEVTDPSRTESERYAGTLRELADRLAGVDRTALTGTDRITCAVLGQRLTDERAVALTGLDEVSVSASVAGTLSMILSTVPRVALSDPDRAEAYLRRLSGLGGYFDAVRDRHLAAAKDGRYPTATGIRQAIRQLDDYLAGGPADDPLLRPVPAGGVDLDRWRARADRARAEEIRPALQRLRSTLAEELLPGARDDDHVGLCHVPGGVDGYAALARSFTTTGMPAEAIHTAGLDLLDTLRDEVAAAGARALGTADVADTFRRLRDDPALRCDSAEQITKRVAAAYGRAVTALPDWFRGYPVPPCTINEMDPIQARGGIAAYYLWPSADGQRPGSLWVNTDRPRERALAVYEVLAFHEGVPGHHLQGVVSADLALPDFRRYRKSAAHSEGWGLYVEHLADEMGLYGTDVDRLGMLASAAWRASRLVVDTGLHHRGWSRGRAVEFMRDNTALPLIEIDNEVDRYIAAPGQALSYMIGRVRIDELRDRARRRLGAAFDIRDFHHCLLAEGSVPLDIMSDLVDDWIEAAVHPDRR
ncbi:DUF885 domain-containing protein [Actinocatenispora sera]|uniref:DUF885 domain-containing protein n=1 Tax=Actinocatenispora sera TaxID=390989 RepID=UPI00340E818D